MTVLFNKFPQAAVALRESVAEVVAETTVEIAESARGYAAVDTGFMRDSIYTITADGSTYGEAGTPPGDSYLLPEADPPEDDLEAVIAVGANYGGFVNYGTRFQSAQPFWEPAIDEGKILLEQNLYEIEPKIKGYIG